jgi:hypothetical protein
MDNAEGRTDGFAINWRLIFPNLYPSGLVPLGDIALPFLGMTAEHACQQASENRLPLPAFKMGKRKSPWVVSVDDFMALVESRTTAARAEWEAANV